MCNEPADGYLTQETVVAYFDRLIRASSQKSRAWSEVAKRYQSFNRPDLSRLVVERAYTSAYLESVVLSRIMLELEAIALPEDRPQLVKHVELAQLVYRSALLRMRDGYGNITDNPTLFGFAPDYIPFPALSASAPNAFRTVMSSARSKMSTAATEQGDRGQRQAHLQARQRPGRETAVHGHRGYGEWHRHRPHRRWGEELLRLPGAHRGDQRLLQRRQSVRQEHLSKRAKECLSKRPPA